MPRRPQTYSPRFRQFVQGFLDHKGWTPAELHRHVPMALSLNSLYRRTQVQAWSIDDARLLNDFMAETLAKSPKDLWLYLTCGEPSDALFSEIELASDYLHPNPRRMKILAGLLKRYEAGAHRFLACHGYLPVSMMPEGPMASHTRELATGRGKASDAAVRGQISFGRKRRAELIENGRYGSADDVTVMMFRSSFDQMTAHVWPFKSWNDDDLYECLTGLVHDVVEERLIKIWLIEDLRPNFPKHLRAHFSQFDHVLAIDDKLLVLRPKNSLDRYWFERSRGPKVAERIDAELDRLNQLTDWVLTGRERVSAIEQLKRFLPE